MSKNYNLSEGSLRIIMKGGDYHNPTMQVLGSKKINSAGGDKERYRLLISDGKNSISFAMLTTQINGGSVSNFSIIQLEKYITSAINNSGKGDARVLLIMDMNVLVPGEQVGEKIGSPTPLDMSTLMSDTEGGGNSTSSVRAIQAPKQQQSNSNGIHQDSGNLALSSAMTNPISSLSPYHNKWTIKARVTNKSSVRTWSNARGEGKLFSVDLVDESGEIRLTGFNNMVEKYYDFIEVDKVYYISKCQLKPSNKQYSTLKNDYEMSMTQETIIQECQDEDVSAIPQTKYNFVTIDKIAQAEVNSLVDVIGIVKNVGELQTFQARSTGKEMKKKEVTIVDPSNNAVALTLWGNDAENFEAVNNPVIVLKCARITEFGGGKNLSTLGSTSMKINPEIPECYQMRHWYDNVGNEADTTNISARSGLGNFSTPWMSFKEVQDQNLGSAEKGDYYQVMGTILLMRSENAMYKACPTPECNKKVIDLENGMYRCEKCNREFPNFKYRLLASMNVGDWTGNQWISMFSSEVEKVLGMTSEEVGQQVEQNPEAMMAIGDRAHFKQFVMKCRAKVETYNDESRLKTVCIKVDPINYEEYNVHLIEKINQLIA